MKIKWKLENMDGIKNRHLRANAEYWKSDLLYNAKKAFEKIQGSTSLNFLKKGSEQLKNIIFLSESKAQYAVDKIDNIVDYTVSTGDNGITFFTIFINDIYFQEQDSLEEMAGRLARRYLIRKKVARQQIIDNFEKEIRETYTKNFTGEILENDGKNLHVSK